MAENRKQCRCYPCSVTATCPAGGTSSKDVVETWSGCIIGQQNRQFVVTHLLPSIKFVSCNDVQSILNKSFCSFTKHFSGVRFQCTMYNSRNIFSVTPIYAWKCSKFDNLVKKVVSNVTGGEGIKHETESCCKSHSLDNFLSWFLVLELQSCLKPTDTLLVRNGYLRSNVNVRQGMQLWTQTHPFAPTLPEVFSGCVTKGVLSNIMQDCLLLTDACCLPGSEGGPVFTQADELVGIVVSPLAMKSGDLSGLTVVCPWTEIASCFSGNRRTNSSLYYLCNDVFSRIKFTNHQSTSDIVVVRHMKGWGSGIVVAIDKCKSNPALYVVTCQHVVKPAESHTLHVRLDSLQPKKYKWFRGKSLYVAPTSWFDFALVKVECDPSTLSLYAKSLKFAEDCDSCSTVPYCKKPTVGMEVYAKGHCLIDGLDIPPTITSGVLSSFGFAQDHPTLPILLHSTCLVHDGASGGALVYFSTGELLGLIVNNLKETHDDKRTVLYPKVNFSLPALLFMPIIKDYVCGNINALSKFDSILSVKSDVWYLNENELDIPDSKL